MDLKPLSGPLNVNVKRPIPKVEETLAQLAGAKAKSMLIADSGRSR